MDTNFKNWRQIYELKYEKAIWKSFQTDDKSMIATEICKTHKKKKVLKIVFTFFCFLNIRRSFTSFDYFLVKLNGKCIFYFTLIPLFSVFHQTNKQQLR